MCFGPSDPCTVCYSVDTTTEHSPLKSSEKGIWWHLIGFFKAHFILDLWMIILLHLWNRRGFCLLRMVWIILAWKTTIDGFNSDVIILQRQKSEFLRILIHTRLKINRNKSLYKFPAPKHVSFRKYSNLKKVFSLDFQQFSHFKY